MTVPRVLPALAATSVLALGGAAVADEEDPHLDVWFSIGGAGQFVVGGVIEPEEGAGGEETFFPGLRVFGAEVGEDPTFPFSTDEPGFVIEDGDVDPNLPLTFLVEGPLERWTPGGLVATGVVLRMDFGPASATTGTNWTKGFEFTADDEGGFHSHFDFTLEGLGGADPANGLYVASLRLSGVDGPRASRPFHVVFNLGEEEPVHEAAIEWVEAVLVEGRAADVDGSGEVDMDDLLKVLTAWGPVLP